MKIRLATALALALAAPLGLAPASAEVSPSRGQHDPRVRVAAYVDGQVYRLATTILNVTAVEFGPGESIVSIVAGDTEGFQLDGVPGGRAFAIKPVASGARTNITVYTNQRSYYFSVYESPEPTYYVVRFAYPETARPAAGAVTAQAPNSRYGVSGEAEFRPTAVWDDGTFTYFRLPPGSPMPAAFRVGPDGERTVNSNTTANGVLRVSGVSARWVLRLGETVVCVEALP